MTWEQRGVTIADPEQVVLESDPLPPALLQLAHLHARAGRGARPERGACGRASPREPRSKVTFDLEPFGELVKLTVVHDGFEPGSVMLTMVSKGWPRILSGLKTLLETGEALPDNPEPPIPASLGCARGRLVRSATVAGAATSAWRRSAGSWRCGGWAGWTWGR